MITFAQFLTPGHPTTPVRFNGTVFCTYDAFHVRIRKDCSEQVCDLCRIRQGGMNPSGNACLSKVWMQRPDV